MNPIYLPYLTDDFKDKVNRFNALLEKITVGKVMSVSRYTGIITFIRIEYEDDFDVVPLKKEQWLSEFSQNYSLSPKDIEQLKKIVNAEEILINTEEIFEYLLTNGLI